LSAREEAVVPGEITASRSGAEEQKVGLRATRGKCFEKKRFGPVARVARGSLEGKKRRVAS